MRETDVPPTLITETPNPQTYKIDTLSISGILSLINREDLSVPVEVGKAIPQIARAVELVVAALRQGGRLFYVGAGTSGRLGVLDAAECPPTFGTSPQTIQAVVAGGKPAVFEAVEGAEDGDASAEISALRLTKNDVLFGIAACGQTPFVRSALQIAAERGCKTVFLSSNPPGEDELPVDVRITVVVGPEVISGSTRMKAGTAAKLVLNMVTTASMIKIGKTYGNLMVDLTPKSNKLRVRSLRMIRHLTGMSQPEAADVLKKAKGNVKIATVMARRGVEYDQAVQLLERNQGFLRGVIDVNSAEPKSGSGRREEPIIDFPFD
jgi:N-acetylmuramic acid 6-phosphate etherase